MHSDDQYIDKPDDFSRRIGEKLREHRMSVDSDIWDSLTDRFLPQRRGVPLYLRWMAAGVAAVALLLLLLVDGSNEESGGISEEVRYSDINKTDRIIESEKETERVAEILESRRIQDSGSRGKKSNQEEAMELAVMVKPEETVELVATVDPEEPLELEGKMNPGEDKEVEVAEPGELNDPKNISKSEEPVKPEKKVLPKDEFLAENHLPASGQEHRKHQSLMASLGSGGALPDFFPGDYAYADSPQNNGSLPGGDYGNGEGLNSGGSYNLLSPDDYTDVVHRPPISFSLTANFPVGENLGLETGLSYTYLFSRFNRNDNFIYRGTLQQHYIGIPVNLRYTVWQNDAWNIYLLAGGSIEKGLRAIYKQEIEYNGDRVHHTDVYSRIDGFQFSAQGGVGFSYRLRDNLSLFGEPRIVYYFKNNQPMSARTDNPLIFGLNMGIRLGFK